MIRITVELVPHGIEERARVLARANIVNAGDHPEHPKRGNYRYWFSQAGRPSTTGRLGPLNDFPRQRENVWRLLQRCLEVAFK